MRWSLLVVWVSCSVPTRPPSIQNTARHARLVCDAAELTRLRPVIAERSGLPGAELRCIAGEFSAPGYYIEAVDGPVRRVGVVDPSGVELVAFADEPADTTASYVTNFWTVDLDGDGQDEVIESWRRGASYPQRPDSWLLVRVMANRKLRMVKGPFLSRYHPDLGSCTATWELRARAIIVAVAVTPGIPASDCLPAGKHRFELVGTKMVDTRR